MDTITQTNIVNRIDLFDFMRAFFCDSKKYNSLTRKAKAEHLFIWNRMMSIQFPVQFHTLSRVHSTHIADILHSRMCTNDPRKYPKWLFTKSKNQSAEKAILSAYPSETVSMYMQLNNIEYKSLLYQLTFDAEYVKTEMASITEQMSKDVKKTKPKTKKVK